MWDKNLKAQIIANKIVAELESILAKGIETTFFTESIDLLKNNYPNLSYAEIVDLLEIIINAYNAKNTHEVDLVATVPQHFKLSALPTVSVINDLIDNSTQLILITGYSISDYADYLLSKIIERSRKGILVKFFVNKFDVKESLILKKMDLFKGNYLEIYEYFNGKDEMAALHAKMISVDNKTTLITSANLSFHGLKANIELGCLINSKEYCFKVHALLSKLIETRNVKRVY